MITDASRLVALKALQTDTWIVPTAAAQNIVAAFAHCTRAVRHGNALNTPSNARPRPTVETRPNGFAKVAVRFISGHRKI